MAEVNPIIITVTILYFAVIIGIGYYTRKASADPMDYYVAGRKIGAFVNGSALAATYFSPASFLGLPAFIFLLGYPFWWALIGIIAGLPLASFLTAAPLRKYAPVSFTDYYADRYESPKLMRLIAGIPVVMSGWAYVTLSLVGMGLFMMAILRVNYAVAIIIGGIVILFYVFLGGMVATSFSTAFQGIVMTVAALAGAFAINAHYGGFGATADAIFANNPNFWTMPMGGHLPDTPGVYSHPLMSVWTGAVSFYFIWHFGFSTMPYTVIRFFTAMDIKSARRACFWAVAVGGAMYWGLIQIGSAARVLMETMHPLRDAETQTAVQILAKIQGIYQVGGVAITDYSMVAGLESLGSPLIMAILVAGGMAIAMATGAGWIMVLNVLFGRDIMGKVLGNKWAIENPVASLRVWSFIIIFICFLFALNPMALVLDLSGWAFVVIICTTGPPLIWGLWWPRATKTAAISTILVFFTLSMYSWLYSLNVHGSAHWFWLEPSIPIAHQMYWIPVSIVFFIIVSLVTKPPADETIKKYCTDLH